MSTQPVITEGAAAFAAICRKGTYTAAGAKIGATEGAARHYAHGRRTPAMAVRGRIAEVYGISAEAWGRPATAEPARPASTPRQDAPVDSGRPDPAPAPSGVVLVALAVSNAAKLREVIAQIERDLTACNAETPLNHKATLFNSLTSALAKLAKLEGEDRLTEAAILRMPQWVRLCALVRGVLERYPGAAAELDKVMAAFEAEGGA